MSRRFKESKYAHHTYDTVTGKHYYLTDETILCRGLMEALEKEHQQKSKPEERFYTKPNHLGELMLFDGDEHIADIEYESSEKAIVGLLNRFDRTVKELREEVLWDGNQIMKRDNLIRDLCMANYLLQSECFESYEDYLEKDFKQRLQNNEIESELNDQEI